LFILIENENYDAGVLIGLHPEKKLHEMRVNNRCRYKASVKDTDTGTT